MNTKKLMGLAAGSALALSLTTQACAGGGEISEDLLMNLQKMLEQQQQQLDKQAAELAMLREQLAKNKEAIASKPNAEDMQQEEVDVSKMVTSSSKNVDVGLYGHLNRAGLWASNGDASQSYFVDNSNSQSRLGLNATVAASETLTVGGKVEYGIKSNASSDVNQLATNDATSVNWNLRHADIFFNSKTIGKFSLGHGSTASDGSSEVDLSGTTVVTYSDFGAVAGGQLFYDGDLDLLSETQVKNVYNNMDGLGRDDRLRYDTPSLAGFSLAGSAVSGSGYDAALKYSRKFGETQLAGAIAYAKPGDSNSSVDNQYSGSISVLLGMGLNATFASGLRDVEDRDDPKFWYAKLGYRADMFSFGKTSFSVDYGDNQDIAQDEDSSQLWSLAAVQAVPDWGTEFYLAYRQYKLDRELENYDAVNAVMAGARVKF